jgi:hypothetical protein
MGSVAAASYDLGLQFQLTRASRRWWLGAVAASGLVTLLGLLIEHRTEPSTSADNTLVSVTFGVAIPLLALFAVARVFPGRLDHSLGEIARHGGHRRYALLGCLVGLTLRTSAAAAVLAVATSALGASLSSSGTDDLLTCAWIGAVAGAAYTTWFLLASTLDARARGRWLALALDWGLGIGTGAVSIPWPRGHVRNLLGGAPAAGLEQWQASVVLGVLALIYGLIALRRTPS